MTTDFSDRGNPAGKSKGLKRVIGRYGKKPFSEREQRKK